MKEKIDSIGARSGPFLVSWEKLKAMKIDEVLERINKDGQILVLFSSKNKILKLSNIDLRRLLDD